MLEDVAYSTCFGHIRRQELVTRTIHGRAGRTVIKAFCPGTGSRIDGTVPSKSERAAWQQDLAVIDCDASEAYETLALVHNGETWLLGEVYTCSDYTQELSDQTHWRG